MVWGELEALLEAGNRPVALRLELALTRPRPKRAVGGIGHRLDLFDVLFAEVFQHQGSRQHPLLGLECGERFEVPEVVPPVVLRLVGVALRPLPDQGPQPVPVRVDRQPFGGVGESLDQGLRVSEIELRSRPDQVRVDDARQPYGEGWIDVRQELPERANLADCIVPAVLGEKCPQLFERFENPDAEDLTLQDIELHVCLCNRALRARPGRQGTGQRLQAPSDPRGGAVGVEPVPVGAGFPVFAPGACRQPARTASNRRTASLARHPAGSPTPSPRRPSGWPRSPCGPLVHTRGSRPPHRPCDRDAQRPDRPPGERTARVPRASRCAPGAPGPLATSPATERAGRLLQPGRCRSRRSRAGVARPPAPPSASLSAGARRRGGSRCVRGGGDFQASPPRGSRAWPA